MIEIKVKESSEEVKSIEIPEDINLSLMEVMRAAGYPIAATCGGIALCATCHVEILNGQEQLNEASTPELDMLDTLPDSTSCSRLACQIRIHEQLRDLVVGLKSAHA